MDTERQSPLAGFDHDDLSLPAPENDELIEESSLSEDPPVYGYPVGASSSAAGDTTLDHDPVLQEADAQGSGEGDTQENEAPVQASSSEDAALDYQIGTWAMLSPDMNPEQARLLEEDIERNGVAVPVDVLDGEVLDGRHREAARRRTGRPPRYNFLPDDTVVVSHLLSRNALRGHHDENERAIYAFKLWRHQFIVAGMEPGASSANLRNFRSQEEIARLLHVSPRSVSSVASVLGPSSTACSALQEAVERRQLKASDAARVLNKPADIQRRAVAEVVSGNARTVLAAAGTVEREISHMGDSCKGRTASPDAANITITLYQATVSQMHGRVARGSVDAIVTFPSSDPGLHGRLEELAGFAAHALKPEGVMAVLTSGVHLPSVIESLKHPELKWLVEFDYRPPAPSRSGPSLNLTIRRWPVLIYGRFRHRLQGGDDVIEVPGSEDSASNAKSGRRLDVGMAMIMERLTQPGQLVCDPLMLDRSDTALAAWSTGHAFIGATESASSLVRIRARLSRQGVPFE